MPAAAALEKAPACSTWNSSGAFEQRFSAAC